MAIWKKLKPPFWDHRDIAAGPHPSLFDFRRKWKLLVLLTTLVAVTPLAVQTVLGHRLTTEAIVAEIHRHTLSLASNTARTISFVLAERRSALARILGEHPSPQLADPSLLAALLARLTREGGEIVDLGVVDRKGKLIGYAGAHHHAGESLCSEACLRQVLDQGFFIGDLIASRSPRQQVVMALRGGGQDPVILCATVDIRRLNDLLAGLETGGGGDAFIVNRDRRLVTPSRFYGAVFSPVPLRLPEASEGIQILEAADPHAGPLIVAQAAIADTPLAVVLVRSRQELMADWRKSRLRLVAFLAVNLAAVFLVILGMATYLVNRIHQADARRVVALHRAEYANKVASLSRLSAGVAHEINNPLAIIAEKTGLTKDLLAYPLDDARRERLEKLMDDVGAAVKRCGSVTRRLLDFARHMETRFEVVDLGEILTEVLSFLQNEADYRRIGIRVDIDDRVPPIESGRGNLQQIFLNLINNAFAAVEDGGRIEIGVGMRGTERIAVSFADNGCGIPEKDLPHVFEPFFAGDTARGGTGLGLSVTYGLVRELDGTIGVESRSEEGARFTVELPIEPRKRKRKDVCDYY